MALNQKGIKKLVKKGRYFDEHGLYLQVISPNNRTWLLRFELNGRKRWHGLGSLNDFNLPEARERARKARQQIADGIDPIDQKREKKRADEAARAQQVAQAITFEQAAQACFDFHQNRWRNKKHRAQFLSTLKQYAHPHIGKVMVAEIDTSLVRKVLDPIWQKIPETARRLRQRIEIVLNYATVSGWRTGLNSARWKGHLDQVYHPRSYAKEVKHHRALPHADVPQFMADLRTRNGTAARALEFLILTASRTSEVTGAKWPEIDLESRVWTIPGERMKAGREHRVPLTEKAIVILKIEKERKDDNNPFVFVGLRTSGLSNMAMETVLRRMGYKDRATVHGFRSTFKDYVADETSFSRELSEAALAHVSGDKVEQAYLRTDRLLKRRRLMEAWARYCITPPGTTNVHSIRKQVTNAA